MSQNEIIIQSYVNHKGKWFFVSTINRESSAALAHGETYSETMAWEWNPDTKERQRFVGQDEHAADSIYAHVKACQRLHEAGRLTDDEVKA